MTIRFEEKVSIENAQLVCQWSNSLGKVFQEQWMGPRIPFPLTLQALEGVFSIFDEQEFVGLIQKIRLEDSNLHIGRFFINPQKQEQDLGSQALRKFVSLAFENEDKGLYMNERYQCLKTKEYQALLSSKGRQIFAKRKIDMKSVFGQIKVCLGYKRCHLRGKRQVRIDMGFILMANNLLKYNKRKRQN